MNLLAGTVATLPLMIYRTLPGKTREPFAGQSLYRILRGNAFVRKLRSGTRIIGLKPIVPGNMAPPKRLSSGAVECGWTATVGAFGPMTVMCCTSAALAAIRWTTAYPGGRDKVAATVDRPRRCAAAGARSYSVDERGSVA